MKKHLGIILLILSSLFLASCSEEEFYEKDVVETIGDGNSPTGNDGSNGSDGSSGNDGSDGSDGTNGADGSNGGVGDTDGSNGSDGSDGTNGSSSVSKEDSFIQAQGNNKVDILWVIDNSGSMGDEQAALAANFDFFIQDFITKNVDFKMAIATTDNNGNPVSGSLEALTSQKLQDNQGQFVQDFKNMIKVGTYGSGNERGLLSSEQFTNNYATNFFRPDAYYIVVFVSDEKDQSAKTPQEYLATLRGWKTSPSLVRAYSIVNMDPNATSSGGYQVGFERYKYLADQSNGYAVDINNSFYQTLLTMGENIATLSLSFVLSENVTDASSIKVFINNVQVTSGWSFNSSSNAVVFEQGSTPAPGSTIKVTYEVQQ